jgi:hypothetical protein
MDLKQTNAVGRVLAAIHREPYIDFATAAERVGILEEVGLTVTPSGSLSSKLAVLPQSPH